MLKMELDHLEKNLGSLEMKTPRDNLDKIERAAIKTLQRNKEIIIKPADKGAAIVVMDKEDYIKEAERQLANKVHYKHLEEPVFPKSIPKINEIFENLANRRFIDAGQLAYLKCPDEPAPRRMYLLPKIHKNKNAWPGEGKVPPGRPIIADCGSESYASAEYVDFFLSPLAKLHNSYLKDTNEFLKKISNVKIKKNAFIATIDVDSLYTNIDNTNGLEAVKEAFRKYPDPKRPDREVLELLKLNLENNDFEFNGHWYLQTWGTSMGKKFAPNYANLFLAEWEEKALAKCTLKPKVFWRFLDDIFIIWEHSKEEFYEFLHILNTHHPSITVKAELNSKSIDFLDVTAFKGKRFREKGVLDTKVFFKPTDTLALLHKKSYHPKHTFKGIIKSQILRYSRICNNSADIHDACRKLFAPCIKRGYTERFLRQIKEQTLHVKESNPSKGYSKQCKGKGCQLCSKQIVVESDTTIGNNGKQIQIPTTQNCNSRNGIYCIVCNRCTKLYVGETGGPFRARITRHRSDVRLRNDTAVATHFNSGTCIATDFRVLYLEVLRDTGDNTLNKVNRLDTERKWQLALCTNIPSGLNTVPSPQDGGVIPFVVTYSKSAIEAARLIKSSYNKLKAKHPNILYKPCVTAYKRGSNLRDILVRSRLGKAPLNSRKKLMSEPEQELTQLINLIDQQETE